jgi:probable rRNA maturation factor
MASRSQSKVCFFFDGVDPWLPDRSALKKFIESIFKREGYKLASLNYVFCTDKRLLQINRDYLQHDYYTDIITFGLSPDPIDGEIYISIDRVRDNARDLGVSFKSELHRVIFHGALHLCGYRDKTRAESQLMRRSEDEYLKRYL